MSKHMIVLGGGESGVGAALLGHQLGYNVFVSDKGSIGTSFQKELDDHQIQWEQGQHTTAQILKADLVIKSPGIPSDIPIVEAIRSAEIPLLSEIEFASLHTDAELIGITAHSLWRYESGVRPVPRLLAMNIRLLGAIKGTFIGQQFGL